MEMCELQHSLLQLLGFTRRADVHFSFVEKHNVVLVVNLIVAESMSLDQFQGRKDNPFESLVAAHKEVLPRKTVVGDFRRSGL